MSLWWLVLWRSLGGLVSDMEERRGEANTADLIGYKITWSKGSLSSGIWAGFGVSFFIVFRILKSSPLFKIFYLANWTTFTSFPNPNSNVVVSFLLLLPSPSFLSDLFCSSLRNRSVELLVLDCNLVCKVKFVFVKLIVASSA